jgi:hypothetical protein
MVDENDDIETADEAVEDLEILDDADEVKGGSTIKFQPTD